MPGKRLQRAAHQKNCGVCGMRVVFINPTNYIYSYGLRCLVSYIESRGHSVKIIFMPIAPLGEYVRPQIRYNYPAAVYKALDEHLAEADVAGLSFVTNFFGQARFISRHIKDRFPDLPVVWGGIHATGLPEKSLEYCDIVCAGEGETGFAELLDRMDRGDDISTCPNMWMHRDGRIVSNPPAPMIQDLDACPFPFFDSSREFLSVQDGIAPIDEDLRRLSMVFPAEYFKLPSENAYMGMTLSSRGCPYHCTYCCNNLLLLLYRDDGAKLLRRRSAAVVVDELVEIKRKMPFVSFIALMDDDFCATRTGYIREFATLYKQKIGLPFKCNATPASVTREKIDILKDAGLISVEMGIQSASERINREIYKRRFDKEKFLSAARLIRQAGVNTCYDVILDNPFETVAEKVETIRYLGEVPKPCILSCFSLTFFPGTEMYHMAKNAGLIQDEEEEIFNKKNITVYIEKEPYIKFLMMNAASTRFDADRRPWTRGILRALTSKPALFLLNRRYFGNVVWPALSALLRCAKKLKTIGESR